MAPTSRRLKKPRKNLVRRTLAHNRNVYATVQRAQSAEWNKRGRPVPWKEWVRSDLARQIRENTLAECNRLYDEQYGASTSGSAGRFDATGDEHSEQSKRARLDGDDTIDSDTLPSDAADSLQSGTTMSEPMDEDAILQDTSGSGGRGPTSGRTTGGATVPLGLSSGDATFQATYSKSRIWYSYAFANKKLDLDSTKTLEGIVTPLAFIPVDFLPFYMSPAEFASIPDRNVWIDKVTCKVRVLGVRSGFDIGATLTGTATSEYCPILHTCVGLNNEIHIMNKSVEANTTQPMIPTGVRDIDLAEYKKKWYTGETSNVIGTPRSNSVYAIPYWNSSTTSATEVQKHTWGNPRLDRFVKTHMLTSTIGEEIFDYSYSPRFAPIRPQDQLVIPNHRVNEASTFQSRDLWQAKCAYGSGKFTMKDYSWPEMVPLCDTAFVYAQLIEKYDMYMPGTGSVGGEQRAQPQLHIGMSAIPQLNPTTDLTSFVNACVYYSVECSIHLTGKREAYWTEGGPTCREENTIFSRHKAFYYENPHTAFGMWDGDGGTIKMKSKREFESPRMEELHRRKEITTKIQHL
ncbi:VP4 [Bactericera trigonica densovirus]|uniref:VP4 n=1 Tax=Bactericera trigonica densovirus TaxID=3070179 RepID=A0A5C1K2U2_9VIRU|nr:VP4 [Bactericera trigonica densovirus]QEM39036.1 VP4 [Bactericera trigonica densovirus]